MLAPTKRLEYVPDPNKFDLQTHAWDAQGKLVRVNHYRLYIIEGVSYYERPVNSGNLWFENNQPAGRMLLKLNGNGVIISKELQPDAPHIEWKKPLEGDEALHYELEQANTRLKEAEAELAAIRAEQAKRLKDVHMASEGFPEQEAVKPAQPKLTKPKA